MNAPDWLVISAVQQVLASGGIATTERCVEWLKTQWSQFTPELITRIRYHVEEKLQRDRYMFPPACIRITASWQSLPPRFPDLRQG